MVHCQVTETGQDLRTETWFSLDLGFNNFSSNNFIIWSPNFNFGHLYNCHLLTKKYYNPNLLCTLNIFLGDEQLKRVNIQMLSQFNVDRRLLFVHHTKMPIMLPI